MGRIHLYIEIGRRANIEGLGGEYVSVSCLLGLKLMSVDVNKSSAHLSNRLVDT